jgi:hypothetical protein
MSHSGPLRDKDGKIEDKNDDWSLLKGLIINPTYYLTGKILDKLQFLFSEWSARRKGEIPPSEQLLVEKRTALLKANGIWTDKKFQRELKKTDPEFRKIYEAVFNEEHKGRFRERLWSDYVNMLYGYLGKYQRNATIAEKKPH